MRGAYLRIRGDFSSIGHVKVFLSNKPSTLDEFKLFYEELTSAEPLRQRIRRVRAIAAQAA